MLLGLLLLALAGPAHGSDATPLATSPSTHWAPELATAKRPAPEKKDGGKKAKKAADRKSKKNYGTGQTIAATGLVTGAVGVVVLGFGITDRTGFHTPSQATLDLSAGLLSVGGLIGSSGALGAGIAVDGASKRPVPVIAGALGLTLGIFAPTFWGVGMGLRMPAFSYAAIGTGAAATLLTAVQMRQSDAGRPKRWMRPRVDPITRQVGLVGTF